MPLKKLIISSCGTVYTLCFSQRKACFSIGFLAVKIKLIQDACAQKLHPLLKQPIHVVFLNPYLFLNAVSAFDSHIRLHFTHLPLTLFFFAAGEFFSFFLDFDDVPGK